MKKPKNTSTVGGRIALVRNNCNLTQEQLAEQLMIHYTRVSKLENGNTEPSCRELEQLCTICNTSADYIVLGEVIAAPVPTLTPEEQSLILALADRIRCCQNSKPSCQ